MTPTFHPFLDQDQLRAVSAADVEYLIRAVGSAVEMPARETIVC